MRNFTSKIRFISARLSDIQYWANKIQDDFGLEVLGPKTLDDLYLILRQSHQILKGMGKDLVKDCGVKKFIIKYLGINKEHFPNHGYYNPLEESVTLNSDIFIHPDYPEDFKDDRGYFMSRAEETLVHEMGHAYDAFNGNIYLQPNWLGLSKWSQSPKSGLKRILIREPGMPEIIGDWYYSPDAVFTRFYAKRSPWEDFADSFSYYVCGLRSKLPSNKSAYFDNLLKKYIR